jgi:predicted CXXCH cytochrome family protein
MPHPAGFLETHSKVVKQATDEVCYRCHDKASCKQCHGRHVHPGIPEKQLKKLLANPVTR